jgi:hypothetical protein
MENIPNRLTRQMVAQKVQDLDSLVTAHMYEEIPTTQFMALYAPVWRALQEWAEYHDYLVGYEAIVDEVKKLRSPDIYADDYDDSQDDE